MSALMSVRSLWIPSSLFDNCPQQSSNRFEFASSAVTMYFLSSACRFSAESIFAACSESVEWALQTKPPRPISKAVRMGTPSSVMSVLNFDQACLTMCERPPSCLFDFCIYARCGGDNTENKRSYAETGKEGNMSTFNIVIFGLIGLVLLVRFISPATDASRDTVLTGNANKPGLKRWQLAIIILVIIGLFRSL